MKHSGSLMESIRRKMNMKERERILELVKEGIISTEEALLLLENMAKKEGKEAVKKDQTSATEAETVTEQKDESAIEPEGFNTEEAYENGKERLEAEKEKDRERLETILEELANKASAYSVQLDKLNSEINETKRNKDLLDEKLMVLQTMEDLDELAPEKEDEMDSLEGDIDVLEAELDELYEEREELEERMKTVKKKQWKTQTKQVSEKFEIPDEWKDTAQKTFTDVNEKVTEAGTQFGKFIKTSLSQVMDNMEWKDVNVRMPGLVSTKFTHEFYYPETTATIINLKVANGNVQFKSWDSQDIKVEADIKLYGKQEAGVEPLEAFEKRSKVELTEESFTFHVPNKSVRTDIVVYLPKRAYDHTALKLLNGNVKFEAFEGKDVYVKSTNGSLTFEKTTATMLEAEGVNGSVDVLDSQIRDLLVRSVNGNIAIRGNYKSSNLSTVNGTVKVTLTGKDITRLEATSVNGTAKVSLPKTSSVEGEAKTNFGSIQNRMGDIEVLKEKKDHTNRSLIFRRVTEEAPIYLKIGTTTGSVMLKDGE